MYISIFLKSSFCIDIRNFEKKKYNFSSAYAIVFLNLIYQIYVFQYRVLIFPNELLSLSMCLSARWSVRLRCLSTCLSLLL